MASKRFPLGALLALFVLGTATDAGAAKLPEEKFWFRFQGYLVPGLVHDTTLRIDSEELGLGTEISYEDDLGFETDVIALRADAVYRLGKRHRISLAYNWTNRTSNEVLEREIVVGDEIFDIGIEIDGTFDTQDIDVNYGYSFVRSEAAEFGASLGLHVLKVDSSIEAVGTGGGTLQATDTAVTAPLPVIGLFGRGAFSDRFSLVGGGQLFAISFDRYSGHYFEVGGGLEFLVVNHFILGLGYAWNEMEVEVEREGRLEVIGLVEMTRRGPVATARFFW